MESCVHTTESACPVHGRLSGLEVKVEKIDARVGSLETNTAVAALEMKHMSRAMDGVLWWMRWCAALGLGALLTAIMNLVLKLPA